MPHPSNGVNDTRVLFSNESLRWTPPFGLTDVQINHQNPALKDNLSKLKEAEQKLRENPTVRENLSKLKEAEQKFRDNTSVQENLSKLKGAEKKWREDAKSKQVRVIGQT